MEPDRREERQEGEGEPGVQEGDVREGLKITMVPPCRLIVRATAGARCIGKRGESIKAIRATSGVNVKVLQDELPEEMKRRQECIILASCGEEANLRTAVSMILDRVWDRSGLPESAQRSGQERPFTLDLIVPERAGGGIVGTGGENVRAIIEELGCEVQVSREPLAGIAAQKRVRLLARERGPVEAALWRLQATLAELAQNEVLRPEHFELREAVLDEQEAAVAEARERGLALPGKGEVPLRVLLAQGEAATVVGKLGANVARLRDITMVSIDDAEAPPFDPAERVCSMSRAILPDRLRALRLVLGDIATRNEAIAREEGRVSDMDAPIAEGSRHVAIRLLLPGDRWSELDSLFQDGQPLRETGAMVRVQEHGWTDAGVPALLRAVELEGEEEQVALAAWRLHQALEPWELPDPPPRFAPPTRDEDEERKGKGEGKGKGKGGGGGGGGFSPEMGLGADRVGAPIGFRPQQPPQQQQQPHFEQQPQQPQQQQQQPAALKMSIGPWSVMEDAQGIFFHNNETQQSFDQCPPEIANIYQKVGGGMQAQAPQQAMYAPQQQMSYAPQGAQYAPQQASYVPQQMPYSAPQQMPYSAPQQMTYAAPQAAQASYLPPAAQQAQQVMQSAPPQGMQYAAPPASAPEHQYYAAPPAAAQPVTYAAPQGMQYAAPPAAAQQAPHGMQYAAPPMAAQQQMYAAPQAMYGAPQAAPQGMQYAAPPGAAPAMTQPQYFQPQTAAPQQCHYSQAPPSYMPAPAYQPSYQPPYQPQAGMGQAYQQQSFQPSQQQVFMQPGQGQGQGQYMMQQHQQ